MKKIATSLLIASSLLLGGCATGENEAAGTVLGGITGAVIGSQFGKGSGQLVGTAVGAMVGAGVGSQLGRNLDREARARAERATVHSLNTGDTIQWEARNGGNRAYGHTRVRRTGKTSSGRLCREYQQTVTIGGRQQRAYGTACRDASGQWEMISS